MVELFHLAANNPDLGGGEQMMLRCAQALLDLGHRVNVVAPHAPSEVLDFATGVGAHVVAIRADGRREYMQRLRAWDLAERDGLLWCHGLVPALATAGRASRLVHLHQLPRSRSQQAALALARVRSERLLTPSAFVSSRVPGSTVCANWTDEVTRLPMTTGGRRVGFLGRLATDKGLDLLAQAMVSPSVGPDARLLVAGDDRWVPVEQRLPVTDSLAALGARVQRLDRVSPGEFFAEVDLAVFPSRVPESFGLVVAEAMAAGVPFVISDAGALPEVAGADHPWVARSGDAEDLAAVIGRALSASDEQVQRVTDRARLRWEEEYSPQSGRQRVQRLLDDLGVG
ncbi:glycosyltransferase family 4 protein [Nocardioides astragali]|uniref:Glycosyltransferase family 4 protein n=1 Tax=Nocardioides astragali TaxID=1776736 RepID=A0ABW2N1C7_9ACTN|nr:glycosyltransferase family 4 protein [Nocardioides astragali]